MRYNASLETDFEAALVVIAIIISQRSLGMATRKVNVFSIITGRYRVGDSGEEYVLNSRVYISLLGYVGQVHLGWPYLDCILNVNWGFQA